MENLTLTSGLGLQTSMVAKIRSTVKIILLMEDATPSCETRRPIMALTVCSAALVDSRNGTGANLPSLTSVCAS